MDRQSHSNINVVVPAITGVVDSNGKPIPHNGTTEDNVLTLSGTGTPNTAVIIADNNTAIALAPANAGGEWVKSVAAAEGRHSYTVADESPAWDVTVVVVIHTKEDFETGLLGIIPVNTAREFPAMVVTPLDKDASLIIHSIAPPFVTGQAVSIADDSTVRFVLKSPVNTVTFGAFASADVPGIEPPTLACFDDQDALIIERKLDFGFDYAAWHEADSPDRRIKTLELTANPGTSAFIVDNFTFS